MSTKYGAQVRLSMETVLKTLGYGTDLFNIVDVEGDNRGNVIIKLTSEFCGVSGNRSTANAIQFADIPEGQEWPDQYVSYGTSDPVMTMDMGCDGSHEWLVSRNPSSGNSEYVYETWLCKNCGLNGYKYIRTSMVTKISQEEMDERLKGESVEPLEEEF